MHQIAPMRRLLRAKRSGLFLKADGEWTPDPAEALSYDSIPEAVRACQKVGVWQVELVMEFHEHELDFAVPLWSVKEISK